MRIVVGKAVPLSELVEKHTGFYFHPRTVKGFGDTFQVVYRALFDGNPGYIYTCLQTEGPDGDCWLAATFDDDGDMIGSSYWGESRDEAIETLILGER